MKKLLFAFSFLFVINQLMAQTGNVGIGTTSPDPAAALDITSADKGILIPRTTKSAVETAAVGSIPDGLLIYDTDDNSFYYRDANEWRKLGIQSELIDADGDTKITLDEGVGDSITFSLDGEENLELIKNSGGIFNIGIPYNRENIGIGSGALLNTIDNPDNMIVQGGNIALGTNALKFNVTGNRNVATGNLSLQNNVTGSLNVANGNFALLANEDGDSNVAIGTAALATNINGSNNVALGYRAGRLSTGSHKLFIESTEMDSDSTTSLIYGEFDKDSLRFNAAVNINGNYILPTTGGTEGQVITANADGTTAWAQSVGIFETVSGVVRNIGDHDIEDFVFGSAVLPTSATDFTDTLMFFDKSKGAFRSGILDGTDDTWAPDNIGSHSFAVGTNTQASGTGSVAGGFYTKASGHQSVAFGSSTQAIGHNSTSLGQGTEAIGYGSTALGLSTTASSYGEVVLGQYNTIDQNPNLYAWDPANRLLTLGNGTSTTPSDAMIVYKNGNTEINGDVEIDGEMQLTDGWVDSVGNTKLKLNEERLTLSFQNNFLNMKVLENGTRIYGNSSNIMLGANSYGTHVGVDNIAIGTNTLSSTPNNTNSHNIALGRNSLTNIAGNGNVGIGHNSLSSSMGEGNVALGYEAGKDETGSNKLYIENSDADDDNALIYGEFDNNLLKLNAEVDIKASMYAKGGLFEEAGENFSGHGVGIHYTSLKGYIEAYNYDTNAARDLIINQNGGNVGIGTSSFVNTALTVKSEEFGADGGIRLINETGTQQWTINHNSSTGNDLTFYYGANSKGYIDNNTDVGAIDFTAQHRNIPAEGTSTDYKDKIGMIVSSNGSIYNLDGSTKPSISESLPHVQLSAKSYDKSIYGVIAGIEDPNDEKDVEGRSYPQGMFATTIERVDENDYRLIINSGGEGAVWVSNYNGEVENGDLVVTSPISGIGMRQDDDIIRSHTVAKIVMNCDFDLDSDRYECQEVTHNGKTYRMALLACVYKCN